jgi:hypothetical protein
MPSRRRALPLLASTTLVAVLAATLAGACSKDPESRFVPLPGSDDGNDDDGLIVDAGPGGPPPLDAAGLCGNQLHEIVSDTPALYFVFDRSGSMAIQTPQGTAYDVVQDAAVDLVRRLGALISVGAAVFPDADTDTEACNAGKQVMKVTKGTPSENGVDGYTTKTFAYQTNGDPYGGTSTSATLHGLVDKLAAIESQTLVLLLTDGAPNCNPDASCDAAHCMTNIDGICEQAPDNCCAPSGIDGPAQCVDEPATVAAIEEIRALGMPVYVIGIPGTELFADVLDAMAIAGGAPQPGPPFYYRVDDLAALGDVFGAIASVAISCEFELDAQPPEEGMTNVYLDKDVLLYDPDNGWSWSSPTTIVLHGEACASLKSGQVMQVQIVSGCPTEEPK